MLWKWFCTIRKMSTKNTNYQTKLIELAPQKHYDPNSTINWLQSDRHRAQINDSHSSTVPKQLSTTNEKQIGIEKKKTERGTNNEPAVPSILQANACASSLFNVLVQMERNNARTHTHTLESCNSWYEKKRKNQNENNATHSQQHVSHLHNSIKYPIFSTILLTLS